ncbi:hypothetical protein M433DRAFT_78206, partial [Acidomyces richmondensis BFW]
MDGRDVEGRGLAPRPTTRPRGRIPLRAPIRSNYSGPLPSGAWGATRPLRRPAVAPAEDSYLVDSASSHMLVSKIKPCKSKYKQLYGET